MPDQGKVSSDMLFVGLTRLPTMLGVSYKCFLLNFMALVLSFIMTSSFYVVLISVGIHFLLFYMTSKEPLFIDFIFLSSKCAAGKVNRLHHEGAESYDPS